MNKVRPAATVLVGREHQGELEVLLLKRSQKLAFAAGVWVFPGGKIDPEELEQADSELAAAKMAAVRETDEETGLQLSIADLQFYHHWTTPELEPRRYATYFFFAATTSTQAIQIDDGEIKDYRWLTPQAAIDQFRAAELAMFPPTLMSLQILSECQSLREVSVVLANRPPLHILPVLQMDSGKMVCLYEGDVAYPTGNIHKMGPRHRLILDFQGGDFEFLYMDCAFPPVNGGVGLK